MSARSEFGHSPLHVAALHDNAEAVDLLLDKVGRRSLGGPRGMAGVEDIARGAGGRVRRARARGVCGAAGPCGGGRRQGGTMTMPTAAHQGSAN